MSGVASGLGLLMAMQAGWQALHSCRRRAAGALNRCDCILGGDCYPPTPVLLYFGLWWSIRKCSWNAVEGHFDKCNTFQCLLTRSHFFFPCLHFSNSLWRGGIFILKDGLLYEPTTVWNTKHYDAPVVSLANATIVLGQVKVLICWRNHTNVKLLKKSFQMDPQPSTTPVKAVVQFC